MAMHSSSNLPKAKNTYLTPNCATVDGLIPAISVCKNQQMSKNIRLVQDRHHCNQTSKSYRLRI